MMKGLMDALTAKDDDAAPDGDISSEQLKSNFPNIYTAYKKAGGGNVEKYLKKVDMLESVEMILESDDKGEKDGD